MTVRPKLRTLWFMGAKTRLVSGFIDGAVRDLLGEGETFLDLCSGTAIVARSLADRYRVLANDTLDFCCVIARAHLEAEPDWLRVLDNLDPRADLEVARQRNGEQLRVLLSAAVEREDELLPHVVTDLSEGTDPARMGVAARAADSYRAFLGETPDPLQRGGADGPFRLLEEGQASLLAERQRDPSGLPFMLMVLYYLNVYFGVRQCIAVDSLRAAIDQIPADDPYRDRKRSLYLAALIYAASVSTSGTSHFAQPRSLRKDSELLAVARRRQIDIDFEFERSLDALRREWGECSRGTDNRVFNAPAGELLSADGPLGDERVGLVYFDPPYTADNHSRFYHLLETLVRYDYPPLAERAGRVTAGRYPVAEYRFQSDFCRPRRVEAAFRAVAEGSRARGANLLVSYSDCGLLLKEWAAEGEKNPVRRFRDLFRDYYPRVEIRDQELMHSGQGDSNRRVNELLVLCEG